MKKEVSLVLSSGGARGIAHIGVIEELLSRDYKIRSISGTSMGALVGGIYAAGGLQLYKEWMLTLDRMDVFNLVDFTFSLSGIVKGDKVLQEMKKIIPDRKIEDLSIPFVAIATDILHEREYVFKEGNLYEAIRASVSIPSVFKPFEYQGLKLVDGAVINPMPINRVNRAENDLLVAVDVNAKIPYIHKIKSPKIQLKSEFKQDNNYEKYKRLLSSKINSFIPKHEKDKLGYFNLLNKTTSIMVDQLTTLSLEKNTPDVLVNISRESFGVFDFYRASELIQLGRLKTAMALDEIEKA